jgi:hypothetical protein
VTHTSVNGLESSQIRCAWITLYRNELRPNR